uniref:hypothetical protein n=1 Tax=Tahibacter sp. TaxID=2056211 RepID=UPI0028C3908D
MLTLAAWMRSWRVRISMMLIDQTGILADGIFWGLGLQPHVPIILPKRYQIRLGLVEQPNPHEPLPIRQR